MGIIQERAFTVPPDVFRVYATNSKVHLCQTPCCLVGFLTIDRNIVDITWWAWTNFSDWTNIPPEPQQGVKNSAFVRFQHVNQQAYDGFWRIELTALFAPSASANSPRKYSNTWPNTSAERALASPSAMLPIRSISSPSTVASRFWRA